MTDNEDTGTNGGEGEPEDLPEPEDTGMEELSDEEVVEVLKGESVGVISMCDEGEPYAVPMSFGYHDGDIYFEFGKIEEGRKFEVLERSPRATLTAYALDRSRWGDATANILPTGFAWASVMATGEMEKVKEPSEEATEAVFEARRPSPANPWGGSIAETDMTFYRMDVEKASGRMAGGKNPALED
jgi:nitroimidazol reductase NimA-like FMN-containing flavoprotein (pyridoxamine 5'-phosphate oxidase superfamily)